MCCDESSIYIYRRLSRDNMQYKCMHKCWESATPREDTYMRGGAWGGGSLHQCVPRVDQKQNQTKTKRLWDRYGMRTTVYIARRKVGTSVGIACKQRVRAVAVDPTVMEGSAVPLHLHRHVPSCLWPWINDENVWLRHLFVYVHHNLESSHLSQTNKQTGTYTSARTYSTPVSGSRTDELCVLNV